MTGDSIDRYARGDLSAAEARDLARASLDSPELFDELTDSALAKAALYSRPAPARRRTWFVIAGLAAAALLISVMVIRSWRSAHPPLKPTLAIAGTRTQPVLLAEGLQHQKDAAPVFRGAASDSRPPQIEGSIVSLEDDVAAIDLGSLDGIDKGSELEVLRDGQAIGRLQVTAIFRERARAHVVDGKIQPRERVRAGDADHLRALVEQVNALYNRGDIEAAYNSAEQAVRWMARANVPQAKRAELWNHLAVMHILRGNYQDAEPLLHRAVSASYSQSMNNLGVVAELRGDRRAAEARYKEALRALADGEERRAVEANVARLQGRH
jgi:tetratricopeptide (TPR) repeat protein